MVFSRSVIVGDYQYFERVSILFFCLAFSECDLLNERGLVIKDNGVEQQIRRVRPRGSQRLWGNGRAKTSERG